MWILWFAFLGIVSFICLKLAPEQQLERPQSRELVLPDAAWLAITIVPAVMAVAIRVLLLPRQKEPGKVLVNMILGLALAEFPAVLTAFLAPANAPLAYGIFVAIWLLNTPAFMRIDADTRSDREALR